MPGAVEVNKHGLGKNAHPGTRQWRCASLGAQCTRGARGFARKLDFLRDQLEPLVA